MKPSEIFEGENSSLRRTFNMAISKQNNMENFANMTIKDIEKETVKRMQEIVQDYFVNILDLPCPDFSFNYEKKYEITHNKRN